MYLKYSFKIKRFRQGSLFLSQKLGKEANKEAQSDPLETTSRTDCECCPFHQPTTTAHQLFFFSFSNRVDGESPGFFYFGNSQACWPDSFQL